MCKSPMRIKMNKSTFSARGAGIAAVPCGQCKNCRINQARIWTNRILLESRLHGENCFVTLTYNDDNLPNPPNVKKKHLQKFIKRVRHFVYPIKFRYFAVGEYGDKTLRPHYHIIFFGLGDAHKRTIFKAWDKCNKDGFDFGELNKDSARYITGYVVKKINKIRGIHPTNLGLKDEFTLSSRRKGGIGKPAIEAIAKMLNDNKFFEKRIIRSVREGKKEMPLGRYLSKHLMQLLEIDEIEVLLNFWANQEIYFEDCNSEIPDDGYHRKHSKL